MYPRTTVTTHSRDTTTEAISEWNDILGLALEADPNTDQEDADADEDEDEDEEEWYPLGPVLV